MNAHSIPNRNHSAPLRSLSLLGFAYASSDIQELGIWLAVGIVVGGHFVVSVLSALVVRAVVAKGRRIPWSNRPFVWLFNAGIFYLLIGSLVLVPLLRSWGLPWWLFLLGYALLVAGMNGAAVRSLRRKYEA